MEHKTSILIRNTFLWIGLLIFVKVITISEAEVTLTSSTHKTIENSSVTLTCSYTGNLTVHYYKMGIYSHRVPIHAGSLLADCSVFAKQPDPALYEYSCPTNKQLVWTIRNVTRAKNGERWSCMVRLTTSGTEKAYRSIFVHVPIQNITMIHPKNNKITVQENTETEFYCKTSGGIPAPPVRWYKGDKTSSGDVENRTIDNVEITSFASSFASNTIDGLIYIGSTLKYSPGKEDNGMRIYCSTNNSNVLTSSRKPQLNVLYSPDGPPTIQNLDEATCFVIENIQRELSCSVNAGNPPATLSWTCFNSGSASTTAGSTITKTVTFTASRGQDRACICQSFHPVAGTKSVIVIVKVLYPPGRPILKVNGKTASGKIKFIQGNTRIIECDSHGEPTPEIYKWTRGGQTIKTGKMLTLNNIQRKDDIQYTCTAEITMIPSEGLQQTGRNSTTIKVDVLYPPTNMSLYYGEPNGELITGDSINVVQNDTIKIECKSDGQPPPKYIWNGQSSDNQSILIATINANINKTCVATNTMSETNGETTQGSSSLTLSFNVVYKATIASFVIEGKEEFEKSSFTVNEKDNIRFACTVDSTPSSYIEMTFRDELIHGRNETTLLQHHHKATSCLDAGVYTCSARNKYNFGNDASAKLKLNVRCAPRPLRQMKVNFTSSLNDTVILTFTTLAYPEPGINGFDWYKQNSFTWIPLLSNTDLLITSSGLQTSLTIKRVFMSDFGHYRVTVTNDIGKYDQYLYLVEKREQSSTEVQTDVDKTGQQSNNTGFIVGVTILGVLFTAVTIYALVMTIYFKRKLVVKETYIPASTKQTTYANETFQSEGATVSYSRSSGVDTAAAIDQDDNETIQQYSDLAHYSNIDQKTYDVIQNS